MSLYSFVLVDDEPEIREGIRDAIPWEELGFSFAGVCTNGFEALELAERIRPDVVMTDINMPFMDGLALADRLVILIWGEDRANVYREGLKAAELLWHKLQSLRFKDIAIGVGEAAETLESLETSYHTAAEALAWGMLREKIGLTASVAASFAQIPTYESALYYGHSFPLVVPIVAGILAGGLFGLFNGVLVAYGKLPPFIATLGTMSIARGIQLIYTKAAIVGSLNNNFKNLAQKSIGPAAFSIPYLGIYVLIITVVIWVLLKHTRQGTNFYAIGGNAQAARVSGINVERDLVCVYFYAGLLYGAAGVLQAGRLGLANALTANGMELDAIAAVTVGGVSQSGGVGTVGGMIIGVFTMGLINYGMSFLSIDSYYQLLVKGAIIIVAVFFDMKKYAKRA